MRRTAEICSIFIPHEIIGHLWNIVDLYGEDSYLFVLTSRRLGDRSIQDIRIDIDGFSFHHSVLGFSPVNFTVSVRRKGNDTYMKLIPSEKALREIRKWQKIRNALTFFEKKPCVPPPRRIFLRKAG
jgi:hypothetical protein